MSPRAPSRYGPVWYPPSVMQRAVLLGRDSWMRFNNRSYRSLPPRPSDHRTFGELELSHHAPAGVRAYAINPVASGGSFHLRYDGAVGVTLSDEPQLLAVNLVKYSRQCHYKYCTHRTAHELAHLSCIAQAEENMCNSCSSYSSLWAK